MQLEADGQKVAAVGELVMSLVDEVRQEVAVVGDPEVEVVVYEVLQGILVLV